VPLAPRPDDPGIQPAKDEGDLVDPPEPVEAWPDSEAEPLEGSLIQRWDDGAGVVRYNAGVYASEAKTATLHRQDGEEPLERGAWRPL
jgi:hypothetical protein